MDRRKYLYTESNDTATYTLVNALGCDSVVTLNLTINNSNSGVDVQTACDTFTWIDGNTYTASNNTATHTLTNATGCDSIVTLDLTFLNSSNSSVDVETCSSYEWKGNLYLESGTYFYDTTNVVGCDSTITLNLTLNEVDSVNLIQYACESYVWNGLTYFNSGLAQRKIYQFKRL